MEKACREAKAEFDRLVQEYLDNERRAAEIEQNRSAILCAQREDEKEKEKVKESKKRRSDEKDDDPYSLDALMWKYHGKIRIYNDEGDYEWGFPEKASKEPDTKKSE